MPDFIRRRTTITGSILALEQEAGAAVLDDKPVDMAAINAARDELAALDLAEVVANERARAEQAELVEQARQEALVELEGHAAAFLGAVTASHKHTAALVEELRRIESLRADMAALMRKLGVQVPDCLTPHEARTMLSRLVAAEFNRLGKMSRYGLMTWSSVEAVENWAEHVAKKIDPAINLGKEAQ